VSAEQSLVASPVWPLGKYLKTDLKKTVLEVYDKNLRPTDGGAPDVFTLNVEFSSVSNVRFSAQTFEAAGWLIMKWEDKRAAWNEAVFSMFPGKMGWKRSEVFVPSFLWPNRLEDKIGSASETVQSDGKGNFVYLTEFRGKFRCPMTLASFPMDVQQCQVEIITRWPSTALVVTTGGGVSCGPSAVGSYNVKYGNVTAVLEYTAPKEPITKAAFEIYFQRDFGSFLNVAIIPCIMLFTVGYSSLFLSAQPARAAFAIICLLTVLKVTKEGADLTPVHVGSIWADEFLLIHLCFAFIGLITNVVSFHPWFQFPKPPPPEAPKSEPEQKDEGGKLMDAGADDDENGDDKNPAWADTIVIYFHRYDLDQGGTIEIEELQQLTVNLVSKLEVNISLEQMDVAIEVIQNEWGENMHLTLPQFEDFFYDLLRANGCYHHPEGEPAAKEVGALQIACDDNMQESTVYAGRCGTSAFLTAIRTYADKNSKGMLPSTNWADFWMQRLLPIAYALCIIIMVIKLLAIAQDVPSRAYTVNTICVPRKDFATAEAATRFCTDLSQQTSR